MTSTPAHAPLPDISPDIMPLSLVILYYNYLFEHGDPVVFFASSSIPSSYLLTEISFRNGLT